MGVLFDSPEMPGVLKGKNVSPMLRVGLGEVLELIATDRAAVSVFATMTEIMKNGGETPGATVPSGNHKNRPL